MVLYQQLQHSLQCNRPSRTRARRAPRGFCIELDDGIKRYISTESEELTEALLSLSLLRISHLHTCTCMGAPAYVRMHGCTCIRAHAWVHLHGHGCTCTGAHACARVHVHGCMCTGARARVHVHGCMCTGACLSDGGFVDSLTSKEATEGASSSWMWSRDPWR